MFLHQKVGVFQPNPSYGLTPDLIPDQKLTPAEERDWEEREAAFRAGGQHWNPEGDGSCSQGRLWMIDDDGLTAGRRAWAEWRWGQAEEKDEIDQL